MAKLSEQLYQATLIGDTNEANRIKGLIDIERKRFSPEKSKKISDTAWFKTKIFNDDSVNPLLIKSEMDGKYGSDTWPHWLPETIDRTIFLDYSTALNEKVREKLLTIKACLNSNIPWFDFDIFSKTILALNGVIPSFNFKEDPTVAQIIKGIHVMKGLRPDEPLGEDVLKYIAVVCKSEGLLIEPLQLSFVDKFMNDLTLQENLKYRPQITNRFRQVVKSDAINDLKEDDMIDIQVKRLILKSAASYTGY